jgi:hypothetical protein
MPSHIFVVFTDATAGGEAEFNDWYTNRHLADLLKIPGIVSAQRFRLAEEDAGAPRRYLAIYEIESNDPAAVIEEIHRRSGTAAMPLSDKLNLSTALPLLYETITPKLRVE